MGVVVYNQATYANIYMALSVTDKEKMLNKIGTCSLLLIVAIDANDAVEVTTKEGKKAIIITLLLYFLSPQLRNLQFMLKSIFLWFEL